MHPLKRLAVASMAGVILGLLGWDVSDGVLYFPGHHIARASHPNLFWAAAAAVSAMMVACLYLAAFGLPELRRLHSRRN